MRSWVTNWLVSTVSLLVAAWIIPGIRLSGPGAALLAALLIGFLNATIGLVLKILTIPLTIVTLGLFLLVVNALMFWLAAAIVPGFSVRGFWAAFFGALLMSIVGVILRHVVIG
jgi:putative membrane protein